ncbi:MAG TPA: hypothetical protein PKK23_00195 [Nitrospirales bacterium]|nr:hypothetical protein [Nitrospiraceae bacterium]HNP27428.1 hypothetical protein [Nitrospirales bacterium]
MQTSPVSRFSRLLHFTLATCLVLGLTAAMAFAQLETEPHPLDTFIKGITNFSEPTGIRGTVRYLEKDRQTLWLDWEQRSDERPLFDSGWKLVPGEATLAVQPRDSEQWEKLLNLSKGLPLELIVQDDGKGHRHILSYQDISGGPKVPL